MTAYILHFKGTGPGCPYHLLRRCDYDAIIEVVLLCFIYVYTFYTPFYCNCQIHIYNYISFDVYLDIFLHEILHSFSKSV